MKQYKIGEFAKMLGVTPDFIKHYESYGLLQPSVSESGYRYYNFIDAVILFECFKYKKWGYTIKEMTELMQMNSIEEFIKHMAPQCEVIRKNMTMDDMMLHDFNENKDRFVEHLNEWYICSGWESYFIPHTKNETIIEDEELLDAISEWTKVLPISKECSLVEVREDGTLDDDEYWGFFLPKLPFDGLGLKQNKFTRTLLQNRYFEMNVCNILDKAFGENKQIHYHNALDILQKHNLKPKGYMSMQIHIDLTDGDIHKQYCVIRIPIE